MPRAPRPDGESLAPASSASANSDAPSMIAHAAVDAGANQRERRPINAPDATRDVAQEDFLFHLYRGSELLQENRVLEAKEELEFALTMQPLDPKGQDLLGAVYFRIGLYPRAIQIYEGLAAQFARDVAVKVNLGLCYLKTGQPEPARRMLQDAVELNPQHKRAWGYLGLALQKLGELEQAQIAFERGGHVVMAERMMERRQRPSRPPAGSRSPQDIDEGVRSLAELAFSELDAGELPFAVTPEGANPPRPGPSASVSAQRPATEGRKGAGASLSTLVAPLDQPIHQHAPNVLFVRVEAGRSFAVRLDALRVIAGTSSTRAVHRRAHDADTHEVLGGIGSPLVSIAGPAELVLAARSRRELAGLMLEDELVCVLEDALIAFDLGLSHEGGRARFDAEGTGTRASTEGSSATVQLRGSGAMVLELAGKLGGVPCANGRPLLVRREWIVGWLGKLVARPLPPGESPNGQRGLVAFAGEGTILLCSG